MIAPALTPRKPGDRIKTDRRDAAKLVRLFRAGELTPIRVPDEAGEAVRDLVRCREDVQEDLRRWRHRLVKFLARHGRVYRAGRHWTQRHWTWLRGQHFALPALDRTYQEYRWTVEQLLTRRADLDQAIAAVAETEPYRQSVGWLRCFRGIDTLGAMILLVEIGDFQRFQTPRELMAYLGLVPSEASSGERERRGSITKAGNTHARRILVEAGWAYRHPPRLAGSLAQPEPGATARDPCPGVAGAAAAPSALPPPRGARQTRAGRRRGLRAGTDRLPLGRPDPGGPGCAGRVADAPAAR